MKQIAYPFFVLALLYSCSELSSETELQAEIKHKNLLGFKTMFLAEFGDDKYELLERELNENNLDIKYLKDIIYVSYLEELNACGQYDGRIETSGDTIKLTVELISDEVCTSTSIDRVTFLIDNPNGTVKSIMVN